MTAGLICCLGIVNRGEAAMRCLRAVKTLRAIEGSTLKALALYTEIDRGAPFVRHADVAVLLRTHGSGVSAYLDRDGVIEALHRGGADAVWPGWGFVAEDPDFADRVVAAGLRFLGPSGATMRALGDKIAAKRLAERAGVPVAAWSGGELADVDAAMRHARTLGFPVVIKAAAGGGGRGIRMVANEAELVPAFQSAATEAQSAFGDGRLFLEQRIVGGRHIEVQIAGDAHGHVLAFGCRDCSVQRRHQKVLEEAPPPHLSPADMERLQAAAVQLAARVGYCGVGTVEFLVTAAGFYFLEVNPRLQVEHGVTEALTGVDLVQLQIRIARGEPLPPLAPPSRGAAIEARVCAEDPDAGFLPAPGRVVRFDPPLAPGVRVDTGVVAGSTVPADFDSLIAKVIASGETREEARLRLVCALSDLELVIAGGASNKGYLLELLGAAEFCAGTVDTTWLDRWGASRRRDQFAVEALMVAAILAYQESRRAARQNFYADTANLPLSRVPTSSGQQIDLRYGSEDYRLQVFARGGRRYRVCLDDRAVFAALREDGPQAARLDIGTQVLRVLYDTSEASIRVEIEGRPHRFGRQTAGQVSAGAPALVIALHVRAGEQVVAGQLIGLLEAMKMEVAVHAPVAGTVKEVCVRAGQQVAAGDVLLVIEPASDAAEDKPSARLQLPDQADPIARLFARATAADADVPNLAAMIDRTDPAARQRVITAEREEISSLLLGYDADPGRSEWVLRLLETALPDGLSKPFRHELAAIRHELTIFSDIEQLFVRTPRPGASGGLRPSNEARLRIFIRRIRAGGAGLSEGFLALLRKALRHYGIFELTHSDVLERAVLRLLASQRGGDLRYRLATGILRRVIALAHSGIALGDDGDLAKALARIARMRGQVPDALADAAIEAQHVIFEAPALARQHARRGQPLDAWLTAAEVNFRQPSEAVLRQLAVAPQALFARVEPWFTDADPQRRAVAVRAQLRRLYTPCAPRAAGRSTPAPTPVQRLELSDDRIVYGGSCAAGALSDTLRQLCAAALREPLGVEAIEVIVTPPGRPAVREGDRHHADGGAATLVDTPLAHMLPATLPARRLTVTVVRPGTAPWHRTFVATASGVAERGELHGIHPEAASRVDLDRLSCFELKRLDSPENIYSFHGRSREMPGDERFFVLADVRGPSEETADMAVHVAEFERAFEAATRALRGLLGARDPRRRLHWNRISAFVAGAVSLDTAAVERLAHRLAPTTRHLGLEKVVVRMPVVDRHGAGDPRMVEIVITDPTGSSMEVVWREPHHEPLRPASDYERSVAEARRRGLVYPYEIIRMLTGHAGGNGRPEAAPGDLPAGTFAEYDLDPASARPVAVRVAERPYGCNRCSVVFGIISTPTDKVPEGMRRVLILSDPTVDMGALGEDECARLVAAIDLAERLHIPVEWLPVSSGARIAMNSGTENLDATARVVRRIVSFTQAGGAIHIIVHGVNVGAQSYFDALSTMLTHTRGVLIMTPEASMVLTGRAALEASGAVAAEDEVAIGGFERIMGPNGEAQYYAHSLIDAYRILYQHYRYTYVVPGESGPRRARSDDPPGRLVTEMAFDPDDGQDFLTVGDIFDDRSNPGRKRPFAMRPLMRALIDQDGGHLERWRAMVGAETAIVWDAQLGGRPICLIGIESQNLTREGYRPLDGPAVWSGGTLFPLSSKKVARALNAASGNRPVVILANLSGFDGSPESMRKLQLEYGAEIGRAVVNFEGPLLFVVVSRYHGGAYVVFSRALNESLHATALEGSYASVIGGSAAAAVVFTREVRARAAADDRVVELRKAGAPREVQERTLAAVTIEQRAEVAAEFDAVHTVQRARDVGSLHSIITPRQLRPYLIGLVDGTGTPPANNGGTASG